MVYLDTTLCPYRECLEFQTCDRALTHHYITEAKRLKQPIMTFVAPPKCHTTGEPKDDS